MAHEEHNKEFYMNLAAAVSTCLLDLLYVYLYTRVVYDRSFRTISSLKLYWSVLHRSIVFYIAFLVVGQTGHV